MTFLLYGAYGYTGTLIAREAAQRGYRPILAGRNPRPLNDLARELELPALPFSLDNRAALDAALEEVPLVLHCAGPFAHTARPMLEACLRTQTHYLDITGEVEVFEMLAQQGDRARSADVMLLPGVGFDVVPTDCLAVHLKERLPDARYLELAVFGLGGVSRGTALTAVEYLGSGGRIRHDGRLRKVPPAWRRRRVDFGRGATEVVSIPWGDLSTAYRSTGIPTIITYAKLSEATVRALRASRYVGGLLGLAPVQRLLKRLVRRHQEGPGRAERKGGKSFVWGQVMSEEGKAAAARLSGPDIYTLTVRTALAAVEKVLGGTAEPGFQTPSLAFGKDFILEIEGVEREDLR